MPVIRAGGFSVVILPGFVVAAQALKLLKNRQATQATQL